MKEKKKVGEQKLYCKEKNLLQLPVFCFEMSSKEKFQTSWDEEDGRKCKLICYSGRGIPGSLEQDVYAACMRIWVTQGMPDYGIEVQYSDIAKILKLDPVHWGTLIKKALLKLGAARYEFTECFIDAKKRAIERIVQFSLFDTTEFQGERKKGGTWNRNRLYFPDEIKINLEHRYYQWMDFELYLSIKSGVSRRLYEYLEKRRYHNVEGTFSISEDKLFRWVPLTNKNISMRRKTLIEAIEALIEAGYLESYRWDRKSKVFHLVYGKKLPRMAVDKNTIPKEPAELVPVLDPNEAKPEVAQHKLPSQGILSPEIAQKNIEQQEQKGKALREEHLQTLFGQLKRKAEALKEAITQYYDKHGFEYVLCSIRYANENSTQNYASYLKQTLAGDWGCDLREEREIERQGLQKQLAEQQAQQQKEEQLAKERALFKQKHDELPAELKSQFWLEAEAEFPKNRLGRKGDVQIHYVYSVREYLNKNGASFSKEVTSLLRFVQEVANGVAGCQ